MKALRSISWGLAIVIALSLLLYASGAFYIVPEYKNAVVTRFGKVQQAVLTGFDVSKSGEKIERLKDRYRKQGISIAEGAGLYFKVPFLDRVHFFESRILLWEGSVQSVTTRDKRTLVIDSSARWRIKDVVKFYKTVGQRRIANNRIGAVINSNIQDFISKTNLIEVVRNEDTGLEQRVKKRLETVEAEEDVKAAQIRYGRKRLLQMIQKTTEKEVSNQFGVELVDVLLTQINYSESVQEDVYKRMRSERKRIAKRYVAQGQRTKQRIEGEYRRFRSERLSSAQKRVQEILGKAEGKSIDIWANAYQKDPEFYRFQRSLKAYENGMDSQAIFVLSDDNKLLEFTTSTP